MAKKDLLLIEASNNGNLEEVEKLLKQGADVNFQHKGGSSALIFATEIGRLDLVNLLLANGAEVNAQNKVGFSALIVATKNGRLDLVNLLLANGANANAHNINYITPLIFAAKNGRLDLVNLLLANGANANARAQQIFNKTTLPQSSSGNDSSDLVNALVANGFNQATMENGGTALIAMGNGGTALIFASGGGYSNIVTALIANGADVNLRHIAEGFTALMLASTNGHLETVSVLLANGAEVNAQNKGGETALMLASTNGHLETVSMLLANGAEVNAQNKGGETALMLASTNGHLETVSVLLANGAEVNAQNKGGETALMLAIENNKESVAELLLKKIHPNCPLELYSAIMMKNLKALNRFLVSKGIDVVSVVNGDESFNPLAQAIKLRFTFGINSLILKGALVTEEIRKLAEEYDVVTELENAIKSKAQIDDQLAEREAAAMAVKAVKASANSSIASNSSYSEPRNESSRRVYSNDKTIPKAQQKKTKEIKNNTHTVNRQSGSVLKHPAPASSTMPKHKEPVPSQSATIGQMPKDYYDHALLDTRRLELKIDKQNQEILELEIKRAAQYKKREKERNEFLQDPQVNWKNFTNELEIKLQEEEKSKLDQNQLQQQQQQQPQLDPRLESFRKELKSPALSDLAKLYLCAKAARLLATDARFMQAKQIGNILAHNQWELRDKTLDDKDIKLFTDKTLKLIEIAENFASVVVLQDKKVDDKYPEHEYTRIGKDRDEEYLGDALHYITKLKNETDQTEQEALAVATGEALNQCSIKPGKRRTDLWDIINKAITFRNDSLHTNANAKMPNISELTSNLVTNWINEQLKQISPAVSSPAVSCLVQKGVSQI